MANPTRTYLLEMVNAFLASRKDLISLYNSYKAYQESGNNILPLFTLVANSLLFFAKNITTSVKAAYYYFSGRLNNDNLNDLIKSDELWDNLARGNNREYIKEFIVGTNYKLLDKELGKEELALVDDLLQRPELMKKLVNIWYDNNDVSALNKAVLSLVLLEETTAIKELSDNTKQTLVKIATPAAVSNIVGLLGNKTNSSENVVSKLVSVFIEKLLTSPAEFIPILTAVNNLIIEMNEEDRKMAEPAIQKNLAIITEQLKNVVQNVNIAFDDKQITEIIASIAPGYDKKLYEFLGELLAKDWQKFVDIAYHYFDYQIKLTNFRQLKDDNSLLDAEKAFALLADQVTALIEKNSELFEDKLTPALNSWLDMKISIIKDIVDNLHEVNQLAKEAYKTYLLTNKPISEFLEGLSNNSSLFTHLANSNFVQQIINRSQEEVNKTKEFFDKLAAKATEANYPNYITVPFVIMAKGIFTSVPYITKITGFVHGIVSFITGSEAHKEERKFLGELIPQIDNSATTKEFARLVKQAKIRNPELGLNITNDIIEEKDFSDLIISELPAANLEFDGESFRDSKINDLNAAHARFKSVDFRGAELTGEVNLEYAEFDAKSFESLLPSIRKYNENNQPISLKGVVLVGDFSYTDFSYLNMEEANFKNALLKEADFEGTNLRGAELSLPEDEVVYLHDALNLDPAILEEHYAKLVGTGNKAVINSMLGDKDFADLIVQAEYENIEYDVNSEGNEILKQIGINKFISSVNELLGLPDNQEIIHDIEAIFANLTIDTKKLLYAESLVSLRIAEFLKGYITNGWFGVNVKPIDLEALPNFDDINKIELETLKSGQMLAKKLIAFAKLDYIEANYLEGKIIEYVSDSALKGGDYNYNMLSKPKLIERIYDIMQEEGAIEVKVYTWFGLVGTTTKTYINEEKLEVCKIRLIKEIKEAAYGVDTQMENKELAAIPAAKTNIEKSK